jgi:hypothetical protein
MKLTGASSPARHVRQFLGLVALVIVLSAGCCNHCGDPPAVALPVPKSLEVIPHSVIVKPPANDTAMFVVEAIIRTERGGMIAESFGHKPLFAVTGGGSPVAVTGTQKHRATVRVAQAGTTTVSETASAQLTDTAQSAPSANIKVNAAPTGPDRITANYTAGASPMVAFVDGMPQGGANCVGMALAFVRVGVVGDLVDRCDPVSRLAVFSTAHAMVLKEVIWFSDAGGDNINVIADQVAPDTVDIAVHLAVALEPEESGALADLRTRTLAQISADVDHTNALLELNRTGIVLKMIGPPTTETGKLGPYECGDVTGTSGVMNVVYVNRFSGGLIGRHCPPAEGHPQSVIYLTRAYSTAGLAHELGHALALQSPVGGHTDNVRDFTEANVMRRGPTDAAYTDRWHFSLGQVFRMNAAAASWLNHRVGAAPPIRQGRLTIECQCNPYVRGPCPPLALDITVTLTDGPPLAKSECNDGVYLNQTNLSDTAYALLSGRPWRSDECDLELPGVPFRNALEGALRLFFPNVESASSCPSRLTVFFQSHAMLMRDIATGLWTPELDNVPIADPPQPLRLVPVYLWFGNGQNRRDDDRAHAEQIFGGRIEDRVNLTGIRFGWKPKDAMAVDPQALLSSLLENRCVPSSTFSPFFKPDTVNVYYIPTEALPLNDGGYTCHAAGKQTYFIFLAESGTAELAHHLGHALGLQDVTDNQMVQTNLMWNDPAMRGNELTLGQVFRMNVDTKSWLQRLGGPPSALDCDDCDRDKCPGLLVDFRESPE